MSCWGCEEAAKDPCTGSFCAGCDDCDARALAQSPLYADAEKGRSKFVYVEFLKARFGGEYVKAHLAAKRWAGAVAALRGK